VEVLADGMVLTMIIIKALCLSVYECNARKNIYVAKCQIHAESENRKKCGSIAAYYSMASESQSQKCEIVFSSPAFCRNNTNYFLSLSFSVFSIFILEKCPQALLLVRGSCWAGATTCLADELDKKIDRRVPCTVEIYS
jgi:disulfide bond formation protein DsbB